MPPAKLKYQKAIGIMLRLWRSLWIHCQRNRIMNRNCPTNPIAIHANSCGLSALTYAATASNKLCPQWLLKNNDAGLAMRRHRSGESELTGGRYRIQDKLELLAVRVVYAAYTVDLAG